jgi:hypothetical protein
MIADQGKADALDLAYSAHAIDLYDSEAAKRVSIS